MHRTDLAETTELTPREAADVDGGARTFPTPDPIRVGIPRLPFPICVLVVEALPPL